MDPLLEDNQKLMSTPELKELMEQRLRKRNSIIRRANRKSRVFVGDSFLKFHLLENFFFYMVLFTVPSMSVIGCVEGHSVLSYFAIATFMLAVLLIDIVNLRYHVKKEILKLDLLHFYGAHQNEQYLMKKLKIWFEVAFELTVTQLNLFDLYTDFAFMTIVYSEKELGTYFILSLISFIMVMIPKMASFYKIF